MQAQHTPGPWRVGSYGPNGCYTVGTERGLMTAMVAHSVNHPEQKEQAIADARLIAAAPELLEALIELRDWYTEHTGLPAAAANAAIAKAVRPNAAVKPSSEAESA